MQVFEIDGCNFSTLEAFYDEISRVLIPGMPVDGWGRNLDAFNDILRGGFGTPDEGFVLCWKNSDVSRQQLGFVETALQLELRLEHCHPANRTFVASQLQLAKSGQGATVFDWLVEIIKDHGPGGSESEDAVELILA